MSEESRRPNSSWLREIERAEQMPPEQKFLEGMRLFDRASRVITDGVRRTHPYASEDEVREIVHRRLRLAGRLANMGWNVLDDIARAHETA